MISKKEFEYTVGRNLAKYRKEKKLTQMQVAEMAELSVPFYASVELGNKGLSVKLFQRAQQHMLNQLRFNMCCRKSAI